MNNPHVLVIDDDAPFRRTLFRNLSAAGLSPSTVPSGNAVEELRRSRFDLLITDWKMPGIDGLELLSAIREAEQSIDTILMTGHANVDMVVDAFRLGVLDVVVKPFRAQEFALRCMKHIQRGRELRGAQEELERTIREQQMILDSMDSGTIVVDQDICMVRFNRAALRLFPNRMPEPGASICTLMHERGKHESRECPWVGELIRRMEKGDKEFVFYNGPVEDRYYHCALGRISGDAGDSLVVITDHTEGIRRSQMEARQSRLAKLGTLAVCVAHELNNPNAAVRLQAMNIELLSKRLEGNEYVEKIASAAKSILTSTQRIASVSNNLLNLGRNEMSEKTQFSVVSVLGAATELAALELRDIGTFEIDIPQSLGNIEANRIEIEQVILNLLVNACQAIKKKFGLGKAREGAIDVNAHTDGDSVRITVSDNGCGIANKERAHIFTPYFTTKPAGEGTGLGLSICAQIIKRNGGELAFSSEFGQGARFTFALPCAKPAGKNNKALRVEEAI